MYQNNLLNLSVDPALPDLLPEGSFLGDILSLDDPTIAIAHPDIAAVKVATPKMVNCLNNY